MASPTPTAITVAVDGTPGSPPLGSQVSAFLATRRSLWGLGEALRIDVPAPWPENIGLVAKALSQIATVDEVELPGCGPVAFGSLPFDRTRSATLIVPAEIYGHSSDGASWRTTVATGAVESVPRIQDRPPIEPASIRVSAVRPASDWCDAVAKATRSIQNGDLTKVVLAREISLEMDQPLDPAALLTRLRSMYPNSMSFAVDGFVGSSPELLVSRIGEIVRAHPMAGTTPRSGEAEADQRRAAELLASEKNRAEHQITIDMVHDTLLRWSSYLDAEPTPSVVQAGPVQHLATMVEGRLSRPAPSVLELVAALHPTPAVGGWPRDAALAMIDKLELADRGPYAGPVGWVDANGNGSFAVGIRSVLLDSTNATLFAGVGVVADSEPLSELEETRAKAQSLLGALVRV